MEKSPRLMAIGASTGGPRTIQTVLENISPQFSSIGFIVQHMPANFTKAFAERLAKVTKIAVMESVDGELALPGHIYVAKGGFHLLVREINGNIQMQHEPEPRDALHRPSVDVFLYSFAKLCGSKRAVILTGMGSDGAKGLHEVRIKGGITAVEAEEDCVVFGMPKAAIQLDPGHRVIPVSMMGRFLSGIDQ